MIRITTETVVGFESIGADGQVGRYHRLPLVDIAVSHGFVGVNMILVRVSDATAAELLVALQRDKPEQDEGEAYCYDGRVATSTTTLRLEIDATTDGDNHAEPNNS